MDELIERVNSDLLIIARELTLRGVPEAVIEPYRVAMRQLTFLSEHLNKRPVIRSIPH